MKHPLIGKKCFLQLEDGRIPDAILKAARRQKFYDLHLLLQKLTPLAFDSRIDKTVAEMVGREPYGEKENDYEVISFAELPLQSSFNLLIFPSRYFQFEVKPNHPLTDFFRE